jgi:hypothetical protein
MQLGVRDDEAAAQAEAAGVKVVMNRCPKIEYGRLSSEISWIGVTRAPVVGSGCAPAWMASVEKPGKRSVIGKSLRVPQNGMRTICCGCA